MAGFKPSVELIVELGADRVVDTTTGHSLRLTPTEVKVLTDYDGRNALALAEAKRAQGVDVTAEQVAALLDRLDRAGFLASPGTGSHQILKPPELLPTDVVPMFREDLKVAERPGSKAVLEVLDPAQKRSFSLYDFEVSIARMLNGRRSVAEVMENAAKIGIPVTVTTLAGFIRQLKAYGFLAAAPASDKVLWDSRRAWSPEVRELFQSGLRLFRANRFVDALEYLGALLEIDPSNTDAQELKRRCDDAVAGAVEVPLSFDVLHSSPSGVQGGEGQWEAVSLSGISSPSGQLPAPAARAAPAPLPTTTEPALPAPVGGIPGGTQKWNVPWEGKDAAQVALPPARLSGEMRAAEAAATAPAPAPSAPGRTAVWGAATPAAPVAPPPTAGAPSGPAPSGSAPAPALGAPGRTAVWGVPTNTVPAPSPSAPSVATPAVDPSAPGRTAAWGVATPAAPAPAPGAPGGPAQGIASTPAPSPLARPPSEVPGTQPGVGGPPAAALELTTQPGAPPMAVPSISPPVTAPRSSAPPPGATPSVVVSDDLAAPPVAMPAPSQTPPTAPQVPATNSPVPMAAPPPEGAPVATATSTSQTEIAKAWGDPSYANESPAPRTSAPRPSGPRHSTGQLPARKPKSRAPQAIVFTGALVVVLVVGALFPVGNRVTVRGEVKAIIVAEVAVPRDGEVEELRAADKAVVHKGEVLATLSTAKLEDQRRGLVQQVTQAQAEARQLQLTAVARKKVADATLARLKAELLRLQVAARKLKGPRLVAAQKAIAQKGDAVMKGQEAVDGFTNGATSRALEEKLAGLRGRVKELDEAVAHSSITAPEDGTFLSPGAATGTAVKKGEAFGTVVDPARHRFVGEAAADVSAPDVANATLYGQPVQLTEASWVGRRLEAAVPAADGPPLGPASLEVPMAGKPLYKKLLGR